jgi:hypothetical protein
MAYGDDNMVWLKILGFGGAAMLTFFLILGSYEAPGEANEHVTKLLKDKGYEKIKITDTDTGFSLGMGWACSENDYHMVEFEGVNSAGNEETGFVCCGRMEPLFGYSKGCTIRN